MLRQPVLRRRHHLAAPETLPKPMPESDNGDNIGFTRIFDDRKSSKPRLWYGLPGFCFSLTEVRK